MISTDKAFDMLPHVVDVYEKLDLYKYYEKKKAEYKKNPVTQLKAGEELFKYVLKNAAKVKSEIISIVALMQELPEGEVAKQNFAKTIIEIKNLFTDKETMDFFKQAMQ